MSILHGYQPQGLLFVMKRYLAEQTRAVGHVVSVVQALGVLGVWWVVFLCVCVCVVL